ncbi:MAG: CRISPR-associated helicase Cas3' [Gammaproteobacteria bacterium]|nr:CRISPR-associated helicase Cas3' [Gammaproteobacteria bacterium]
MLRLEYFAHSNELPNHKDWHRLSDHLESTGDRAAEFLDSAGCGDFGKAAGLLHDLGKYTREFQKRLAGGPPCDHATAGAKVAIDRYRRPFGKMLAFCISGHHAGLANGVNGERISALADRLDIQVPSLDPTWKNEISLTELTPPRLVPRDGDTVGFSAALFIRMVFSALVDADFIDTETYYAGLEGKLRRRGHHPTLSVLSRRLDVHLEALAADAEHGAVNDLRKEVLDHVRGKAGEEPGLFTLTVPTGGGKTLTSLAFALDHAVRHGRTRVIYVIPYMSIIEQTAAVFRDALAAGNGEEADFVVEHHSTFDEELIGNREARDKLQLAMENWDAPIIVTTAVQFFETLFANRPSRCRKLHNIANSVIILDEAQTLPIGFLQPCVTALDELARNWRASIVLCTATQPALARHDGFPGGFDRLCELAPEPRRLYRVLKRTRIDKLGTMDDAQLSGRLRESRQALCIVNTRRHARDLYESLGTIDGAFHLTTLMCAQHRRERLEVVRERLEAGEPVILVATPLVEAGVDVDFPVVWRAETGLESIIQAAGRCNREGNATVGNVYVFKPADGEGRKAPPEIAQFASAARTVMRRYEDPLCLDAINDYFSELYWIKGEEALDAKHILRLLSERKRDLDFPFETIAARFRLIETQMVPIVVPYLGSNGDDKTVTRLLEELKWVDRPGRCARRLQPYVVQVQPFVRTALLAAGAAEIVRKDEFADQFVVLTNSDLYRKDVGLTWDDPTFRTIEGLLY